MIGWANERVYTVMSLLEKLKKLQKNAGDNIIYVSKKMRLSVKILEILNICQ